MKLTIPQYRAMSRNMTNKRHWTHYVRQLKEVTELVSAYNHRANVFTKPVVIEIEAYYKGKRHVDTSNLDDKIIVDAIMKVGLIKDDTAYENPRVIKSVYPESGEDKLVITITLEAL